MTALLGGFLQTAIKFIIFILIAWGGIFCGKKFRDSRDAKKEDVGQVEKS